jgi:membrane protein
VSDPLPIHRRILAWHPVAVAWRVLEAGSEDDVDVVSAGLAFYALMGLFPGLLAMVSLYGLIADPSSVAQTMQDLVDVVPAEARGVVKATLLGFTERPPLSLSLSVAVPALAVLWSASAAMAVFVRAINVAYKSAGSRGFFARRLLALGFTLGAIVSLIVVVPAVTSLPLLLRWAGAEISVSLLRWPVLFLVAFVGLLVAYRFAPEEKRFQTFGSAWPGAALGGFFWVLLTSVYSFYVGSLTNFANTYGALQGVIALAFWLYASALIILYAAELNAELARPTGQPKEP